MDMHVGMLIGAAIYGLLMVFMNTERHPVSSIIRIIGWGMSVISIGGLIGHWLS